MPHTMTLHRKCWQRNHSVRSSRTFAAAIDDLMPWLTVTPPIHRSPDSLHTTLSDWPRHLGCPPHTDACLGARPGPRSQEQGQPLRDGGTPPVVEPDGGQQHASP